MQLPVNQLKELLDRAKNILEKSSTYKDGLNQQEYLEQLSQSIENKTGILLKPSTLYKKIILPISKNEISTIVNVKYRDALVKYVGFESYEAFEKISPFTQTVLYSNSSFYTAYTFEETDKVQVFRFGILYANGKTQARLQSTRNDYFGTLEERPNNLFLDLYSTGEQPIKTNVVLFIGANEPIQQKAELLLGVYTQVNREGKPLAARAAFIRKEVSSFEDLEKAEILTQFDQNYDKIPLEIRRYLFSKQENIVNANDSQAFKMSDLKSYAQKGNSISPYAGYYKLFFTHTSEALTMNRMQILPVTGRVFFRSRQRNWSGYAEKKGGNLFIELNPSDSDEKAFITLFVGNEPTFKKNILYKGVFTSINGACQPFAGRVVVLFEHKLSMKRSLFDEVDELKYPTNEVGKEDLEINEIWEYLVKEERNQLDIGRVKFFDERDLQP